MREILFRGKRKGTGEWVYGFYAPYRTIVKTVQHRIYTGEADKVDGQLDFYPDFYPDFYNVIPETVGQYTGLKDKNNVETFEGDIVACNQSGSYGISVIIYDNSAFYVMPLNGNILERTLWDYWYNDWDIEVIGNIHDNPELLEVKEHE